MERTDPLYGPLSMRSIATILALMVAIPALAFAAGCLGAPSAEQVPGGALEHKAQADETAKRWDPDAELVSVSGGEGDLEALVQNGSLGWLPEFVEGRQGDLGDGRSPRWAYEYQAGEEGLGVLVSANGTVIESLEVETSPQPALTEGRVDSTDAIEQARQEHPRWRGISDGAGVAYALYHSGSFDRPVWALGLLTEQDERVVVIVDALTGEDLGVSEDGRDPITPSGQAIGPQTPPRAAGTYEGNTNALDPEQSWAIVVQSGGHPELGLVLQLAEPATGTLNATLSLGGRELRSFEAGPTEAEADAAWPLPEPGDYVLELELEAGIDQDYTLHWCAPGVEGGSEPTPACEP